MRIVLSPALQTVSRRPLRDSTSSGGSALAAVAVELSVQLASALERIAAEQHIATVDLAAVWFVD
jgi:hypothetical protein